MQDAFVQCPSCGARLIAREKAVPVEDGEASALPVELCSMRRTPGGALCVADVFDFESVSVTHAGAASPAADAMRFLACADCHYGPIGYALLERRPPLILLCRDRVQLA